MATESHIAKLMAGRAEWNKWRSETNDRPDLRNWNFEKLPGTSYSGPELTGYDFSGADLHGVSARNSFFIDCNFDDCSLNFSDLCFSYFRSCSFSNVEMRVTKIGSAHFAKCSFEGSDLSYCSAEETSFKGSTIRRCSLEHCSLVKVDFSNAELDQVLVYAASAWDLDLTGTRQRDLIVTSKGQGLISVDNLEIAQFIHLLVRNSRLRDVIDTITSKVVLILGRFTPDRKEALNEVRRALQSRNYVPVLFDFDGPASRDLTETIRTLAHLARFVVVDLTDPRSVPHELANIVPMLPSVPVLPILLEGHEAFAMFEHYTRFPWVLPVVKYTPENLTERALSGVSSCEDFLARTKTS